MRTAKSDFRAMLGLVVLISGLSVATPANRPSQAPQKTAPVRLILSEVFVAPTTRDTSFVELANVGADAVDISEFVLQVDTATTPLPRLTTPMPRGGRVLILFDGKGTVQAGVIHSALSGLRPQGGSIALLSNDERLIDRLAWGDAPDAVRPPTGGLVPPRITPGSSYGRPPGADQPGAPAEWVIYPPDQVTPGKPNPLPAVAQLLPMNGAILPATSTDLSWYPVPGAARYRVQLGTDATFAKPLLNQVVEGTSLASGPRPAGVYWWRVQAIAPDGVLSAWSYASRLEFERRGASDSPEHSDGLSEGDAAAQKPVLLHVALIHQSKDSGMLLLESSQEGGPRTAGQIPAAPHNWDRDHPGLDMRDPADNMNCAIASMTMLNRYYNGDLGQDRIGYEVFSKNIDRYAAAISARRIVDPVTVPAERAPGPERDLNYGYGLTFEHIVAAGIFALGDVPGPGSGVGRHLERDRAAGERRPAAPGIQRRARVRHPRL